jgi:hypothetical protein
MVTLYEKGVKDWKRSAPNAKLAEIYPGRLAKKTACSHLSSPLAIDGGEPLPV